MKMTRTLQILATMIIGAGPASGNCEIQTYYYSGPVSAWTDVDLSPLGLGQGGFRTTFGTLAETLYFDPTAGTLEQVGSVTVSPSGQPITINGSIFTLGEYGTASLVVGNNGCVTFDNTFTGVGLGCPHPETTLLVPVSATGTYDGNGFSNSWDIAIQNFLTISAAGPTSLVFSESSMSSFYAGQASYVVPGTDLCDGTSDGTYYYSWNMDGVAVTEMPDEANSLALLSLGLLALAFLRRR